jgi:hypothetical protein
VDYNATPQAFSLSFVDLSAALNSLNSHSYREITKLRIQHRLGSPLSVAAKSEEFWYPLL